ncbi:hypothetical protein V502_04002 [Pseudogymnoascus sp. VKM F-4520 (FW-2644)]|nr:hypothetical protein V502_04002 [Pseudogymnoascus sp. VKM F-4520 (FW-2644)]
MILPVTTSAFALAIISYLAPSVMAGSTGSVYFYNCGNCKCDAVASKTGWTGQTDCMSTGPETRALGLTGLVGWSDNGAKTTCELYTDSNCSKGQGFQSIGVEGYNKWGCTAFNQNAGISTENLASNLQSHAAFLPADTSDVYGDPNELRAYQPPCHARHSTSTAPLAPPEPTISRLEKLERLEETLRAKYIKATIASTPKTSTRLPRPNQPTPAKHKGTSQNGPTETRNGIPRAPTPAQPPGETQAPRVSYTRVWPSPMGPRRMRDLRLARGAGDSSLGDSLSMGRRVCAAPVGLGGKDGYGLIEGGMGLERNSIARPNSHPARSNPSPNPAGEARTAQVNYGSVHAGPDGLDGIRDRRVGNGGLHADSGGGGGGYAALYSVYGVERVSVWDQVAGSFDFGVWDCWF